MPQCPSCRQFLGRGAHDCASAHVPVAPLRRQVDLSGGPTRLGWPKGGSLQRAWYRAQHGGVSRRMADRFAASLGIHPAEIWGDAWWTP